MKLSSGYAVTFCFAASFAQATGLVRGNAKPGVTESDYGAATIILDHVSTPGKWNNKVVTDAFKKAYNDVHNGEDDASVDWGFVDNEVEVPEDDHVLTRGEDNYRFFYKSFNLLQIRYTGCFPRPGDRRNVLPPMMVKALDYPDLHAEFETVFCKLISEADPTSFGEVSKCQIDFTYSLTKTLGQHYHGKSDDDSNADYETDMRGELDISHVLKHIDENETLRQSRIDTMGNCFVDTYNMIHADGPNTLTGFELEHQIEVDEDDVDEENDDGDESLSLSRYYVPRVSWSWFRFQGGCRFCAPDDRKFLPPVSLTMGEHQAFEATFANCLRESGLYEFSKIRNPHIRFTYTGAQEIA